MASRSISDEEISLIKAMLGRGISKTEIQAYFTRPDRTVNFGRIHNIESDEYGPDIVAASEAELDKFLEKWRESSGVSAGELAAEVFDRASLSPVHPKRLADLFEKAKKSTWTVVNGETDEVECKEGFNVNGKIFRTVTALANNNGGYVLFGIRDSDKRVVGLKGDKFQTTDIAKFSQWFRSAMEPMPRFEIAVHRVGRMRVGVVYVHPVEDWPTIATKTSDSYHEGTVYYRYPGESRAIEAADFRSGLAARDGRARQEARQAVTKALELGPDAGVIDLASGRVDGQKKSFFIDDTLLEKIRFIREGTLDKDVGEPVLNLIGDVYPVSQETAETQIIPVEITDNDLVKTFLSQGEVVSPLEFVRHSCHTQKKWLPVFYFIKRAEIDLETASRLIEEEEASNAGAKKTLLKRLHRQTTAFRMASGRTKDVLASIVNRTAETPSNIQSIFTYCDAVCGLENVEFEIDKVFEGLSACRQLLSRSTSKKAPLAGSNFRKACCRMDELLFIS